MSAVDQLENGVRVRCADGTEIRCKPLTLKAARRIMALWNQRFAPEPTVSDSPTPAEMNARLAHFVAVGRARMDVVTLFGELYPELTEHISPGDVEMLIPDFFWCATGATVPAVEAEPSPPIGTGATASTAPPGASSPTP